MSLFRLSGPMQREDDNEQEEPEAVLLKLQMAIIERSLILQLVSMLRSSHHNPLLRLTIMDFLRARNIRVIQQRQGISVRTRVNYSEVSDDIMPPLLQLCPAGEC